MDFKEWHGVQGVKVARLKHDAIHWAVILSGVHGTASGRSKGGPAYDHSHSRSMYMRTWRDTSFSEGLATAHAAALKTGSDLGWQGGMPGRAELPLVKWVIMREWLGV